MTTENQRAVQLIGKFLSDGMDGGDVDPRLQELGGLYARDLLDELADAGLVVVSDASDGCINDHPAEQVTRDV